MSPNETNNLLQIADLISANGEGRLNPEQKAKLETMLTVDASLKLVYDSFNEKNKVLVDMKIMNGFDVELSLVEFHKKQAKPNTYKRWPRLIAAASIVLVAGTGFYFYNTSRKTEQQSVYANDIDPGKNGATLTLANGKKILINDASAGNIAFQPGVRISKTADGQIIYEITGNNSGKIEYNILTTTRGEQTQVRLPDGSLVFLNASSSLKYPASFSKLSKREVSLTGEGYFEVAKDKHKPFIVKTSKQEVSVLGTRFNISSYEGDDATKTTLFQGSVNISDLTDRKNSVIIQPGQECLADNNGLHVKDGDLEKAMAWKNGYFLLENENFKDIMNSISKWYDVDIVYESIPEGLQLEGKISRSKRISTVLNAIQATGKVNFKVEGRRVTVID